VEPALLLLLRRQSLHGYALIEELTALGVSAYPVDSSAVYRALRRLEKRRVVRSDWEVESTSGPPRRVYTITPEGRRRLETWVAELRATRSLLDAFLVVHDQSDVSTQDPTLQSQGDEPNRVKEIGGHPVKVVVSANGAGLDAEVSPIFGRCPHYVYVDVDTMQADSVPNASQNAPGGAGIQAAQTVVESGAEAVLSGNVGPNALEVLTAAGLPVYAVQGGTVRDAITALKEGRFAPLTGPTARAHAGMAAAAPDAQDRQREIAALAQEAAELRSRLANVMTRLDKLERGE